MSELICLGILHHFAIIITCGLLQKHSTGFWTNIRCQYLVRKPGVQPVYQFIPKVCSEVEVRALWKLLKFFHINVGKPWLYRVRCMHKNTVLLKYCRFAPLSSSEGNPYSRYSNTLYKYVLSTFSQQFEEDPYKCDVQVFWIP